MATTSIIHIVDSCTMKHNSLWSTKSKSSYTLFFYQPRKILEAREIHCAKDPLNRDDEALLPKEYLHLTLANKKK